jgi:hypothetical protein
MRAREYARWWRATPAATLTSPATVTSPLLSSAILRFRQPTIEVGAGMEEPGPRGPRLLFVRQAVTTTEEQECPMFSVACFAGPGASRCCPPTVPGPDYTISCVPLAATVGVLTGRPPTPDTELVAFGSDAECPSRSRGRSRRAVLSAAQAEVTIQRSDLRLSGWGRRPTASAQGALTRRRAPTTSELGHAPTPSVRATIAGTPGAGAQCRPGSGDGLDANRPEGRPATRL